MRVSGEPAPTTHPPKNEFAPHFSFHRTFCTPTQNWEPFAGLLTAKGLFGKYFVLSKCPHISLSSKFCNLHAHFKIRASFKSLVLMIPSPPKSFGRHTFSHFTMWYLNFSISPPLQKNLDLTISICTCVASCNRNILMV